MSVKTKKKKNFKSVDTVRKLARERKQRQREREKGVVKEIRFSADLTVCRQIDELLLLSPALAPEIGELMVRAVGAYHEEYAARMSPLIRLASTVWPSIRPLLPYSKFLQVPGQVYRINLVELRSDDWLEMQPAWNSLLKQAKALGVKDAPGFFDRILEYQRASSGAVRAGQ